MGNIIAVQQSIDLETEDCCNCGVMFAMPASMRRRLQERGGSFYCPNGHSQHYTETEVMRLREQLSAQVRMATQNLDRALRAEALAKEKDRKLCRVHNGVCPCCKRTFQNLARHMKTKHPEVTKS